tara:strand:+ start:284 stop:469 length:186 start_codon:yes stop_codon:yes gene_type:complete
VCCCKRCAGFFGALSMLGFCVIGWLGVCGREVCVGCAVAGIGGICAIFFLLLFLSSFSYRK